MVTSKHINPVFVALTLCVLVGVPPAHAELVAHYKFEDNLNDEVNANTGTWVGTPDYADGTNGRCLNLPGNGSTQYVKLTATPEISMTGDFSVSVWVKRNSTTYHECIFDSDGGVTAGNIDRVVKAGAQACVAGTAVFGAKDRAAAIQALRDAAGSRK